MTDSVRFPITFDGWFAALSTALLLFPSASYVEIAGDRVRVRMGWGFRATFDRRRVTRTFPLGREVILSRGVHGWAGRWLVNGSGTGILAIELEPAQRGWVMGFPVSLRQLQVSVGDPAALAEALRG